MSRKFGYAAAWLVAAAVAIAVGVAAVSTVGASIRGRGPLGNEVIRNVELGERTPTPDPDAPPIRDRITGEYGVFVVECRGIYAYGIETRAAPGWRVVSFEQGPDDDVDAVFSNGRRSTDLEVFCNRGRPTIAEIEHNTLPD